MRICVLGTGTVGRTIADKLLDIGHSVTMGSRTADSEPLREWLAQAAGNARGGAFSEAAEESELIFNCTSGENSLEALSSVGEESLAGKVLVDVANPLDFSAGMPPTLTFCNDDSLGERIQAAHPEARVVKALNTVNHLVMVDPGRVAGVHDLFICGDDDAAKSGVRSLLESFGWPPASILDLGDISASRGMEMYLPLWLRLYGAIGSGDFNVRIQRR